MASGAVILSAAPASAWQEPGHLESTGTSGRTYNCKGGGSYCSESLDPNDKSPSTGIRFVRIFPIGGTNRNDYGY